ncbi:MAG: mitochondrial fission ELM1 family protein [Pseudomonadota bacterium]
MRIWILTDGKIGDLVQCRGVAAHLDTTNVQERVVAPTGIWAWPLPLLPVQPSDRAAREGSPIAPPYPDLVLASGRRTVPYLRAIKRASKAKIVFLKDPRWIGRSAADFIWAPVHDRLQTGATVIATHTSPHGLTRERLDAAKGAAPFDALGRDVTGIILGGDSGAVNWDEASSSALADLLAQSVTSPAAITPSRRTPDVLKDAVRTALPDAWFDEDGSGYLAILANAARIVVTGDSHNMVSEALATGAPVHVHRPPNLQFKLASFLDAMVAEGAVRDLAAPLVDFEGKRRDATAEIAAAITASLQK